MIKIFQDLYLFVRGLLMLRLEVGQDNLFQDICELVLQGYHTIDHSIRTAAQLRDNPEVADLTTNALRVYLRRALRLGGGQPRQIPRQCEARSRALMLRGAFTHAEAGSDGHKTLP